jgi:hypothetical protein
MIRTGWDRVAVAALLATAGLLADRALGQEPGIGQRVGEKLDEAGAAIRRDVGNAGDAMREGFHKARASVNAMGIEARVYGRLRWDKALDGAAIEVAASRDGTVTLTGTVADVPAKAKAGRLAGDTVGVTRVVDQLGTATPTPAPPSREPPGR